ncbi:MAG TPA: penicillin-binding transpeptidase domain-containing protein, partial [Tichowtungia sp.]|nr:penicillin-binding transpeptidase domain-containing protein [Tichowtungia sp.]
MNYKARTIFASAIIAAVFAGLGVRLAFLHLKPSEGTLARIERGRHLEQETRGPRGRILDRAGNILAVDIAARHLCADPKFILEHGDIQQVCEAVSNLVPLSRSEVWTLLDQPERQYVRIQRYMREKTLEPLMKKKLKGVIFEETSMRNYPKGALGAHVIGFSNRQGIGSAGAELRMNSYLQGTTGLKVSLKDGRRHEIYTRRSVNIEPQPGADVYLTIDQQVQYFVERALDDLVQKYQPQGAWAIVQRVDSGEILAMASWPTFNPNRYNDPRLPFEWMRNRAIGFGYEPGSVMKAMIIASAIDGGYVTSRDMFDCENGRWMYGG